MCPGKPMPEAFGLVDHIRDVARRFANIGYNALAPDPYSRASGPTDPGDINMVFPVMFGLPDEQAVRNLEAAAAHLRGLPGATAKGRRDRLLLGRPAHAAVRLHQRQRRRGDRLLGRLHPPRDPGRRSHAGAAGAGPRPRPAIRHLVQATLAVYRSEEDQNPPVALEAELKQRAAAAGKDVTTKIYREAGHAFLADYRPSYRGKPAFELWADIGEYFARRLKKDCAGRVRAYEWSYRMLPSTRLSVRCPCLSSSHGEPVTRDTLRVTVGSTI